MDTSNRVLFFTVFGVILLIAVIVWMPRNETGTTNVSSEPERVTDAGGGGAAPAVVKEASPALAAAQQAAAPPPVDGIAPRMQLPAVPGAPQIAMEAENVPEPEDAPPQGVLQVRIVDALGEPVANAGIEIGGGKHKAPGGEISVDVLPQQPLALTAFADGYESVQQTIDSPAGRSITVELEYLCAFEVFVYRSRFVDVQGVGSAK